MTVWVYIFIWKLISQFDTIQLNTQHFSNEYHYLSVFYSSFPGSRFFLPPGPVFLSRRKTCSRRVKQYLPLRLAANLRVSRPIAGGDTALPAANGFTATQEYRPWYFATLYIDWQTNKHKRAQIQSLIIAYFDVAVSDFVIKPKKK